MEGLWGCMKRIETEKCLSRRRLASSTVDIRWLIPGEGKNTSPISSISLISSSFTGLSPMDILLLRDRLCHRGKQLVKYIYIYIYITIK